MERISRARLRLVKSKVYYQTYQWYYYGTLNLLKAGMYFETRQQANEWLNGNYEVTK